MSERIIIRKATLKDLEAVKRIADVNRASIGFVLRAALIRNIERGWLLVAEEDEMVVGFANYRHRRDDQTTLYEICVAEEHRGNGVGRALLDRLITECQQMGKRYLRLKCPADNEANAFYSKLGFEQVGRERGKRRELIIWEKIITNLEKDLARGGSTLCVL